VLIALAILAVVFLPSPWGAVAVAAALAGEVLELVFWRRFLRRYRIRVGVETLIGESAQVVEACEPMGQVRVRGELWRARSATSADVGQTVRIVAVDGLTLDIEATG
jgi:membrane-bound serine protease (ClpP class)